VCVCVCVCVCWLEGEGGGKFDMKTTELDLSKSCCCFLLQATATLADRMFLDLEDSIFTSLSNFSKVVTTRNSGLNVIA
jgi:hypothetical protein